MTVAGPAPLVGRAAELDTLLALLEPVPGRPTAAIVSGDAGIGKTRLLREFGRVAAEGGALVLVGHCVSFGGDAVPFLPVSEAFGRLARDEPETVDRLREQFPPLARLLPARRMVGSGTDEGRIDPIELYEAVLGALLELAATRRVVLVVEDLHWADGATRDLLGFLLTRLAGEPVAVVASYRSDDLHRRHPLRRTVLEWGRLPGMVRVHVEPLGRDDVGALVDGLLDGADMDERARAGVLDRAQGNPFFAEQLLAEVTGAGGSAAGIPPDLADLLLLRLERLSDDARHVLQVIAVAGLQITHDLLARVAGLDGGRLDDALREATEAHLLDTTPTDGYAFRHALLAEAVYDDLLPGERRRLHAQFAEVIASQELPGTDADLAKHAREGLDLPTAFHAGVRAGDEAMRIGAPAEAKRLYEAAQELAPLVPDPSTVADLPRKAARAASQAGYPFRAIHLLQEALERLPADADPQVRAELLLDLVEEAVAFDTDIDLPALTDQALALVPEAPPTPLRARALSLFARVLATDLERTDEALVLAEQAREVAVLTGTPNVEVYAATTQARMQRRRSRPEAAERLLLDSVERAADAGDVEAHLRSLATLATLRYEAARLVDARRSLDDVLRLARDSGRPWSTWAFASSILLVQLDYVTGRWDEAVRLAQLPREAPALVKAGMTAAALAVHVGRGAPDVQRLGDLNRPWWSRDALIAILGGGALIDAYGQQGDGAAAVATLDELVRIVAPLWGSPLFDARVRLHALALAALAAQVGQEDAAGRRAAVARGEELVRDTDLVVERYRAGGVPPGPEAGAWSARVTAEWARLRWRAGIDPPSAEELVGCWRAAVTGFDWGHRYESARSGVRLAAALQATGDPAGAARAADEAAAVARELRAAPLLAELAELGVHRPRAERRDQDLTPRERQVLELLAEGRTNREIGRALYITDKTVSVHVSNIMAKLGAAGRTEAAAIARRTGLLDATP